MAHLDSAFQPLTHAEFSRLTLDEKLAYLARAVERLGSENAPIFAGPPPSPSKTDLDPR